MNGQCEVSEAREIAPQNERGGKKSNISGTKYRPQSKHYVVRLRKADAL